MSLLSSFPILPITEEISFPNTVPAEPWSYSSAPSPLGMQFYFLKSAFLWQIRLQRFSLPWRMGRGKKLSSEEGDRLGALHIELASRIITILTEHPVFHFDPFEGIVWLMKPHENLSSMHWVPEAPTPLQSFMVLTHGPSGLPKGRSSKETSLRKTRAQEWRTSRRIFFPSFSPVPGFDALNNVKFE